MEYVLFLSSMMLFAMSMCFTPGPNNTLAMAIGLDKGFRAALPLCLGGAIGANLTLLLAGLGLSEVFVRFPILYAFLRYIGAAYMLWLAYKISGLDIIGTLSARIQGKAASRAAAQPDLAARIEARRQAGIVPLTFTQGILFQLVNVKVWITNILVVTNYVGAGDDKWIRLALVVALFTTMGSGAICLWAAGGVFMRRFLSSEGMRRCNYIFATFLVLSVALLFI